LNQSFFQRWNNPEEEEKYLVGERKWTAGGDRGGERIFDECLPHKKKGGRENPRSGLADEC